MQSKRMNEWVVLAVSLGAIMLAAAGATDVIEETDLTKVVPSSLEQAKDYAYPYEDVVPGGWEALAREMGTRTSERTAIDNMIILPALSRFVLFEGRFPESVPALLDSPYSAIRAADLTDPMTKKPFNEVTASDVLSVRWIIREGTDIRTTSLVWATRLRYPGTSTPVDLVDLGSQFSLYSFLAPGPGSARHGYRKGSVPDAVLTANAVQEALNESKGEFRRLRGRAPVSFAELTTAFPYLLKLRNGFSGGYAAAAVEKPAVLTASGTPILGDDLPRAAPGDFVVLTGIPGRGIDFVVYGSEGHPIRGIFPGRENIIVYK